MKDILLIFQEYTGAGFFTILYLLALLYLWVSEKNEAVRSIFVYGAGVLQLLFFIPLFYYGYQLLDKGTYYRILWLLPMTMTIAYSGVKILGRYPRIGMILGVILIAVSGKCVYSNTYMSKAENAYHIPQEAIDVCEMIMPEEGQERVTGVFPDDLIHFIRQYTSEIQMAYGRDYLAPDWTYGDHPLRQVMNLSRIPAGKLAALATEYNCNYIVLSKGKDIAGNLESQDMVKIGETEHYDIYQNNRIDIIYEDKN